MELKGITKKKLSHHIEKLYREGCIEAICSNVSEWKAKAITWRGRCVLFNIKMEVPDFFKDFPDKHKIISKAFRFEGDYKYDFFIKLENELGPTKAASTLEEFKNWFDKLDAELVVSSLDTELKNHLFYGFAVMYQHQRSFVQYLTLQDSRPKVLNEGYLNPDWQYYDRLTKVKSRMPEDTLSWRKEWQNKFQSLIDEFEKKSGIKDAVTIKKGNRTYFGLKTKKIPKTNKDLSAYLKNQLAKKLKGGRYREKDRLTANNRRAAELIKDGAMILGIDLPVVDELRRL